MGKSRGKAAKRGWKRIPGDELGELLPELHSQRAMAAVADSELFFEDVEMKAEEASIKLTRRQKAALEHRIRMQRLQLEEQDVDMKEERKPKISKVTRVNKLASKQQNLERNKRREPPQPYDIWADEVPAANNKRKKRPQYVPSVLPAVMVPPEGASYNPPLDSYLKFVERAAKEEAEMEAIEQRLERNMEPTEAEMALPSALRDELHVFTGEEVAEGKEETGNEETMDAGTKRATKPKTMKEKRRQKVRKIELKKADMRKKMLGTRSQQLQNLKSLNREVSGELEAHKSLLRQRRAKRTLGQLTQRKRLGRGKFEPFQEPVLNVDELPSNLRQLSAQGNVFLERLKSLQQRNILPIGGDRQQAKKSRLKVKFVEKRSAKGVSETSRVI